MTSPSEARREARRVRLRNWALVGSAVAAISVLVVAYPYAIEAAWQAFGVRSVAWALAAFAIALGVALRAVGPAFRSRC